jgi:hypothetical protein
MMKAKRSGRREDIWAGWRAHLEAQRASGQSQVAYCRARGLDPRYFSVWKGKLAGEKRSAGKAASTRRSKQVSLRLVPLVVKNSRSDFPSTEPLSIQLSLHNGLSVSLSIPSVALLRSVLDELASQTPC